MGITFSFKFLVVFSVASMSTTICTALLSVNSASASNLSFEYSQYGFRI